MLIAPNSLLFKLKSKLQLLPLTLLLLPTVWEATLASNLPISSQFARDMRPNPWDTTTYNWIGWIFFISVYIRGFTKFGIKVA